MASLGSGRGGPFEMHETRGSSAGLWSWAAALAPCPHPTMTAGPNASPAGSLALAGDGSHGTDAGNVLISALDESE